MRRRRKKAAEDRRRLEQLESENALLKSENAQSKELVREANEMKDDGEAQMKKKIAAMQDEMDRMAKAKEMNESRITRQGTAIETRLQETIESHEEETDGLRQEIEDLKKKKNANQSAMLDEIDALERRLQDEKRQNAEDQRNARKALETEIAQHDANWRKSEQAIKRLQTKNEDQKRNIHNMKALVKEEWKNKVMVVCPRSECTVHLRKSSLF